MRIIGVNFREISIKGKVIWFELAGNSSYRGSNVINNVVFFFSVTNEETPYEQLHATVLFTQFGGISSCLNFDEMS